MRVTFVKFVAFQPDLISLHEQAIEVAKHFSNYDGEDVLSAREARKHPQGRYIYLYCRKWMHFKF